jgi:pyruvate dehydrogenase E2 component (dihydrolipoyllysine-residue acetyltransferase)
VNRVRMPPLGQTSDEIRIEAWLKQPGEEVTEGETLLEVETDKATLEVEASSSGVLLAIVHEAGTVVTAGEVIGWIGEPGEEIPADSGPPTPAAPPRPAEEPLASPGESGRTLAAPVVRALAREHGLDINLVQGTGPGGRVERQDVLAAIAQPTLDGEPVPAHRQAIAARLTRAAAVPQFSLGTTVELTRALIDLEATEGATVTHLLLRAVASALRLHPDLNRIWLDEGPRLRALEPIRVGLAVAAEDRLLVPTVPEPDREPLAALVTRVNGLINDARAGRIAAEHTGAAAVTVSNLGMFGVDWFQAIVDPDQAAILAAGTINRRAVVTDDGIAAVPQIELVLSVDHRVADGAAAARFLQTLKAELE